MQASNTPILFVKSGCPWCEEALSFFKSHSVELEVREVRSNKPFMEQMIALSGQTKAPTFALGNFIVADFDVSEFKAKLAQFPAIQDQLGIQ